MLNKKLFNNIINIITIIVIIYLIYSLINDYIQYKKFDKNNITKPGDIDIIGENYKNCKLYNIYNNLSNEDKEYLYHVINESRIKYKDEKPSYEKKMKSLKNNILYNMLITLLLKHKLASAFDTAKHNVLLSIF